MPKSLPGTKPTNPKSSKAWEIAKAALETGNRILTQEKPCWNGRLCTSIGTCPYSHPQDTPASRPAPRLTLRDMMKTVYQDGQAADIIDGEISEGGETAEGQETTPEQDPEAFPQLSGGAESSRKSVANLMKKDSQDTRATAWKTSAPEPWADTRDDTEEQTFGQDTEPQKAQQWAKIFDEALSVGSSTSRKKFDHPVDQASRNFAKSLHENFSPGGDSARASSVQVLKPRTRELRSAQYFDLAGISTAARDVISSVPPSGQSTKVRRSQQYAESHDVRTLLEEFSKGFSSVVPQASTGDFKSEAQHLDTTAGQCLSVQDAQVHEQKLEPKASSPGDFAPHQEQPVLEAMALPFPSQDSRGSGPPSASGSNNPKAVSFASGSTLVELQSVTATTPSKTSLSAMANSRLLGPSWIQTTGSSRKQNLSSVAEQADLQDGPCLPGAPSPAVPVGVVVGVVNAEESSEGEQIWYSQNLPLLEKSDTAKDLDAGEKTLAAIVDLQAGELPLSKESDDALLSKEPDDALLSKEPDDAPQTQVGTNPSSPCHSVDDSPFVKHDMPEDACRFQEPMYSSDEVHEAYQAGWRQGQYDTAHTNIQRSCESTTDASNMKGNVYVVQPAEMPNTAPHVASVIIGDVARVPNTMGASSYSEPSISMEASGTMGPFDTGVSEQLLTSSMFQSAVQAAVEAVLKSIHQQPQMQQPMMSIAGASQMQQPMMSIAGASQMHLAQPTQPMPYQMMPPQGALPLSMMSAQGAQVMATPRVPQHLLQPMMSASGAQPMHQTLHQMPQMVAQVQHQGQYQMQHPMMTPQGAYSMCSQP